MPIVDEFSNIPILTLMKGHSNLQLQQNLYIHFSNAADLISISITISPGSHHKHGETSRRTHHRLRLVWVIHILRVDFSSHWVDLLAQSSILQVIVRYLQSERQLISHGPTIIIIHGKHLAHFLQLITYI